MPALTIKNIPDELYNDLKLSAEQHHRSINSEVIVCLKRTLQSGKIDTEDTLKNILALRAEVSPGVVTADEITDAINEDRP